MEKRIYHSREKVKAKLLGDYGQPLQIAVRDTQGSEIPVLVVKEPHGEESTLTITPYGYASFRPGTYKLKITDPDGVTHSQEFEWGVLAINTNKSIYTPGDTAVISMAVLDELGNMVCDAHTQLDIIAPDGSKSTLNTWEGSIKVTQACHVRTLTYTPDYMGTYEIKDAVGTYEMILTAETKNGKRTITDSFQVKESVPFDVERVTATRIFPINVYDVRFKITANQDFTGKITESVPSSFKVDKPVSGPALGYDEVASKSALIANAQIVGLYITPFSVPFSGDFRTSLGFDDVPDDTRLQYEYKRFGLNSHDGVDFAMPVGTPVQAIDSGEVMVAGWDDYGITVVLQHPWGRSYYGHLSKTDLKLGEKIDAGSIIGLSGNTGLSTGPHLHFAVLPNNPDTDNGFHGKVNPYSYLRQNQQNLKTATLTYNELNWNISIKKGETVFIGYSYDAPEISPQLHLLGPLEFKTPSAVNPIPTLTNPLPTTQISQPSTPSATLIPTIDQPIQNDQNTSESTISAQTSEASPSAIPTTHLTPLITITPTIATLSEGLTPLSPPSPVSPSSSPTTENRPLTTDSYTTIFSEARRWQIAVDVDVLIDNTVSATNNNNKEKSRVDFISDQTGYVFYSNSGAASCVYKKTTNGGTSWSSETNLTTSAAISCQPNVSWFDQWTPTDTTGTFIHIGFIDVNANEVYYERIDTANNEAQLGEVVVDSNSIALTRLDTLSITKSTTNVIYIGISDGDGSALVRQCSTNCGSGANWTDTGTSPLDPTADAIRLLPLAGGNIMLIRDDISAEVFQYNTWNGSSWAGWNNIDANAPDNTAFRYAWGATLRRWNNNLYLAYVANVGGAGTADIRTAVYNGSTWTSKNEVLSDQNTVIDADIALDEESGHIYTSYIRSTGNANNTVNVYYKRSTDGMDTWENETQLNSTITNNDIDYTYLNIVDSERIFFVYYDAGANDYYGGTVVNLTPPVLDELLKHGDWWSRVGKRKNFTF